MCKPRAPLPSVASFWGDAHVDAGLQNMSALAGFVVVCNCTRLGMRRSVVGARFRQYAWAEAIEMRARGEWSVTAFEFLGIDLVAVGRTPVAVIDRRRGLIVR